MKPKDAVHRAVDWLEPPSAKIRYEPPSGAGRFDFWVVGLFVPAAIFTALVLVAPLTLAPGSTGDLSGRVGSIENAGVWGVFPEPARSVYHVGDVACHTKASRSFVVNDNQMPFCARDVAIFIGLAVGLALCVQAAGRLYPWVVMLPWWSYLALLAPIAVDGGAQDFLGFESDNVRRLITGFPAGLAVAFSLVFIVYEGRFAVARVRERRAASGQAALGDAGASAQADERSAGSASKGSLGSKAVESAPTEKKNPLHP